MRRRHAISDEQWERIKDLLPGRPGTPGRPAEDNRLFVDAVLWIGKTGAPWRDLPERFGDCTKKGVLKAVFGVLQDPVLPWLILDSIVVWAHPHAAGAKKTRTGRA